MGDLFDLLVNVFRHKLMTVIVGIVSLLMIVVGIAGFKQNSDFRKNAKQVGAVYDATSTPPGTNEYTYRYNVDGKAFSGTTQLDKAPTPVDVFVYYLPSDPAVNSLTNDRGGSPGAVIFVGLVGAGLCWVAYKAHKKPDSALKSIAESV